MGTIGNAIQARLTAAQAGDTDAQTSAVALLAAQVGKRVYPLVSDQNVYPCITYQAAQENEDSIQPLVAKEFSITITVSAKGRTAYAAAHALKDAVRALLDRTSSQVASAEGNWGGVVVGSVTLQGGGAESYTADAGNPDALYYEITDTYRAWAQA